MSFSEKLNEYIAAAECTLGDLSKESGLSSSTLSRYRSGSRVPDPYGSQIPAITAALARLSAHTTSPLEDDIMTRELISEAGGGPEVENVSHLLDVLGVSNSNLARFVPFDASFISRVRNGKSHPADADVYVEGALRYIVNSCASPDDKKVVAALIGVTPSNLADSRTYFAALRAWTGADHNEQSDPTEDFLATLDSFNLDEYLRAVHFDEIKLPPQLPHMPTVSTYQGLAELRQGELDFFRSLVTSRTSPTLFMCTDMPMEDMAEDIEFGKKWMIGVAATLKRGVHLNIIHNIDRPYREMMLGLESWIPLYMTGQVSPFYLPGRRDEHYMHALYAAETIVLLGEGIAGHHDSARYYVSRKKGDIAYGKTRAQQLLAQARPLMDIYRAENASEYIAFVMKRSQNGGLCRRMMPTPPLFTLPEPILEAMLARSNASDADVALIRDFVATEQMAFEGFFAAGGILTDTVAEVSVDEFDARPVCMMFPDIFCQVPLQYTRDEYLAHVQATEQFAQSHSQYTFVTDADLPFHNIRVTLNVGSVATISKGDSPCIHFVIRHPLLRKALENMVVAIAE